MAIHTWHNREEQPPDSYKTVKDPNLKVFEGVPVKKKPTTKSSKYIPGGPREKAEELWNKFTKKENEEKKRKTAEETIGDPPYNGEPIDLK